MTHCQPESIKFLHIPDVVVPRVRFVVDSGEVVLLTVKEPVCSVEWIYPVVDVQASGSDLLLLSREVNFEEVVPSVKG